MKKYLLLFVATIFLSLTNFSFAQQSVMIQNTSVGPDSSQNPFCSLPAVASFNLYGYYIGGTPPDTLTIYTNFGDGTDTTFQYITFSQSFYPSYSHTYTIPGQFSIQYIVTASGGEADTVETYNQVVISDSCGNISGKVYIDANANCVFDGLDAAIPWAPVELLLGSTVIAWNYSDINGDYYFEAPIGPTYTVKIYTNYWNNSYSTICPSSGIYSVTAPAAGNDFAFTCLSGFDLAGYVGGWGFRPNFPSYLWINAHNLRCTPTSGTVTLTLDPLVSFVSSNPAPASVSGNTLTWNFSNLSNTFYSYWWNSFFSNLHLQTSASATIGDSVCFTLTVNPITGDANDTNNVITRCFPVTNSWDPNEKEVFPKGDGASGDIAPDNTQPMSYTVYFQNTGTDTAYNVFILDTLDTDLDVTTFKAVSSSHAMEVNILAGNVIKFSFNNIMLPDSGANEQASHGYVSYLINQKQNLSAGTEIENTAGIYFDFNPPVITNTTLNTIAVNATGIANNSVLNRFSVYPNPATAFTEISYSVKEKSEIIISVYDVLGKMISVENQGTKQTGNYKSTLNFSNAKAGVYFVDVKINGESSVQKLTILK